MFHEHSLIVPELAPFTKEDIPNILSVIEKFPEKEFSTKVFYQHDNLGTCWYDSMFTLLFESGVSKRVFSSLQKQFFHILFQNEMFDLSYSFKKTELLAKELKEFTNSSLDISFWVFIANTLQRYILLGYIFYKEPGKVKRRKSWDSSSFEILHKQVRSCLQIGQNEVGIQKDCLHLFVQQVNHLLHELSKENLSFLQWTEDVEGVIEGYYISVEEEYSGHILCLLKQENLWYLYNNNIGISPFTQKDSERITTIGIDEILLKIYVDIKTHMTIIHLKDNSLISVMSHYQKANKDVNYKKFSKEDSFILVWKK